MNVTAFLAQSDFSIALKRGNEVKIHSVDQLQVLHRGVPRVEENRASLNSLIADGADEHLAKMIVLRFTVGFVVVDAIVYWKVIAVRTAGMQQVDDTDTANQTMFGTAILKFDQLDRRGQ